MFDLKRGKFLPSGNVEITFVKAKNNQFHGAKTSMIAKYDLERGKYCPVIIIRKYFILLNKPKLTLFPSQKL